ncbi:hypothetical protein AZKH_p0652 (plasmid) [Azoarcus sp. KH32C]|nr:lipoyl synthase [Azoarcus sp. KH32C]BAL27535.1 hypothetical protein AZKH_p0652 [Azoarcus sp. KH32C]
MQNASTPTPQAGVKLRGAEKTARIPIKIVPITPAEQLRKPEWIRAANPEITVEVLTPDFRGRVDLAFDILASEPPDVFNHNIETVPRLYREVRPGADYEHSLDLLARFKARHPNVATKSGLMLGVGETREEIEATLADLRAHAVDMVTIAQYLQPSLHHLPVRRYVTPAEFDELRAVGEKMGFRHVASGPTVRSSYHADLQARGVIGE